MNCLRSSSDGGTADLSTFEIDELDQKTDPRDFENFETEGNAVTEGNGLSRKLGRGQRQRKSELSDAERTLLAEKELTTKLTGSCFTKVSEREDRWRLRVED